MSAVEMESVIESAELEPVVNKKPVRSRRIVMLEDPELIQIAINTLRDKGTVHRHLTKALVRDSNHITAIMKGVSAHGISPLVAEFTTSILKMRDEPVAKARHENSKDMERIVKSLPIASWIKSVPGAGFLNVALIIASTGDLHNYATISRVWKRMGVGVMPDGQRQRKFTDPELAILAGYSPQRRSIVWILGDCLLKQNYTDKGHETPGEYRQVFEEQLGIELARLGATREAYDPKQSGHRQAKARAKRYMEKRFLLDLWKVWRSSIPFYSNKEMTATVQE